MQTLIISDLHLGNDGPYDTFAGGEVLPALLDAHARDDVRVIVDGDGADFLLNQDPLELDADRAVEQARAIAGAATSRAVLEAFGRVLAAGGEVLIRLGNHDIELALPGVQQVFREALGQPADVAARLRFELGDEPKILDVGGARVLVTHGEQNDKFNQVDYDHLRKGLETGRFRRFRYSPGSRLCKTMLNPLKVRYRMRFADLLKPDIHGAVLTALAVNPSAVRTLFQGSTLTMAWQLFKRRRGPVTFGDPDEEAEEQLGLADRLGEAGLSKAELAALQALAGVRRRGGVTFGEGEQEDALEAARIKLIRDGLAVYARAHRWIGAEAGEEFFEFEPTDEEWAEAERLADKFDTDAVVIGHTHAARFRASSDLVFVNTGTWISLMSLPAEDADDAVWVKFLDVLRNNPTLDPEVGETADVHTRFTFARLEPHPDGGAELALCEALGDGEIAVQGRRHIPAR